MTLIKDRTNFGSGWVIEKEWNNESGDHIKKEFNKYWTRETISNEQRQVKYVFYERR